MREKGRGGAALLFAVAALASAAVPAQADPWSSTTGVGVSTGDYGGSDDTTITQVYETVRYQMERGDVGLTLPYLFRDGGGTTPGESRVAGSAAIPQEADGLGDVKLRGRYYAVEEAESRPGLDWTGFVKFPTASDDKGLGTGRFDAGLGPELTRHFGSLIGLASMELVLRDRPDNSTLKAVRLDYSIGAGYPVTDRWTAYLSLDGGTPSSSGADAPLELVASSVCRISESVRLEGYLLGGLTDGSPDFGAGAAVRVEI